MPNPGSIAAQVPYGNDAIIRRIQDGERAAREQSASRGLGASEIGNGGELLVQGSLRVTGSITVPGTLSSAGSLSAGLDVVAARDVVAIRDVNAGGNVNATGNVNGSHGVFPGGVNSTDVYNHLLTYGGGYRAQYIHIDGTMGYVPSSRQFKQDEKPAVLDPKTVRRLQLVTFRYIAAVTELGDGAAIEYGLIAEEVDALGLTWLVDYDEAGKPFGLKIERVALALIPVIQDDDSRLTAIEKRLAAAGI
jgi:hypothetical protein